MKTTLWLDRCIVTGLGEAEVSALRFNNYSLSGGVIEPAVEIDEDPPECKKTYKLAGQKLLISLYELYDQIEFGELTDHPANLIARWCMKHIHPYNIRDLYESFSDVADDLNRIKAPGSQRTTAPAKMPELMEELLQQQKPTIPMTPRDEYALYAERLTRIGTFSEQQFLSDAKELYYAVKTYHAIMANREGDSTPAEALAVEGRTTDGMEYLSREILSGKKLFAEYIVEFCYLCRPLNMELSYDVRWKEFIYAPILDSVFDIAWFALYRIAVSGARSAVDDKRTFHTIQCRSCGRTVVTTGNNQRYCDDAECQLYKKAKNQRDRRARIKDSENE